MKTGGSVKTWDKLLFKLPAYSKLDYFPCFSTFGDNIHVLISIPASPCLWLDSSKVLSCMGLSVMNKKCPACQQRFTAWL